MPSRFNRLSFKKRSMRRRRPRFRKRISRRNKRTGGFMGIELKFYDQKLIDSTLQKPTDAAGGEENPSATIALNTVIQGDGESNRIGRKITMKSIQIEGTVTTSSKASGALGFEPTQIFIALVLDTQCNGALLNSEDVFTNPGANVITAAKPFRNLQQSKRFRILATRTFTMTNPAIANDTGATGGIIANGLSKPFKIFKRLGVVTNYTGTTETIANIADNSLNIVAYCNDTELAPKLNYICRLRFLG